MGRAINKTVTIVELMKVSSLYGFHLFVYLLLQVFPYIFYVLLGLFLMITESAQHICDTAEDCWTSSSYITWIHEYN